MFLRDTAELEVKALASEIFNRSWQFIEQDAVLAGEDRQEIQTQLSYLILQLLRNGDRNMTSIANQAIGTLRERYAKRRNRWTAEGAA